jgi:uncharacterized protein YecE (DUF72 family)
MAVGVVRIGISGWRYASWRGTFYPRGLRQKDELTYAASLFRSIELNGTFYSLRRPENFAAWAGQTPPDFVFSIKAPRYITHMLRLRGMAAPLANFLASGLFELGPKLGPILWQFPPGFSFDPPRVKAFLALLPHDTHTAAAIARHHDRKMEGRTSLEPGPNRPMRHAMEIRNQSFVTPRFLDMLRAHDVALVCADTVEWPRLFDLTADFCYCRLHGSQELYASGYDHAALDDWADRVAAWAHTGRDVHVYFDNDAKVRAPVDALGLERRVRALLQ